MTTRSQNQILSEMTGYLVGFYFNVDDQMFCNILSHLIRKREKDE